MNDHHQFHTPSERTRGVSRRRLLIISGGLAVIALVAWRLASMVDNTAPASKKAAGEEAATGVFRPTEQQWAGLKLAVAQPMAFHTEHVTDGKISINDDKATPVFSPYSGRITRLIAKPGDVVNRGDPLFAVQASEIVQGQNDLIAAVGANNKARKQLDMARVIENRQHELYLAKAGSLKDWQQAQVDLTSAENDARATEIAASSVRKRLIILGKTDEEIQTFEAAATMNAEAVVAAPITGTVIQRKAGLGQYIQAGATDPQFSIGDLATVWLVANVRETDAPLMRVGQPIELRLVAYPGKIFKARLTYVAPSVDPANHRLPVRAEAENPDGALKPEMFASFTIASSEDVMAPAVPKEAIVYEADKARVWVAQADKSIVSRAVRVGRANGAMIEVLEGLAPGEQVVTSGALFIDHATRS